MNKINDSQNFVRVQMAIKILKSPPHCNHSDNYVTPQLYVAICD